MQHKKYSEMSPFEVQKSRARTKLKNMVRTGKINKPEKCQACGKLVTPNYLHGHHYAGYDKPVDVQWLCHWCHHLLEAGAPIPRPEGMWWCIGCKCYLPNSNFAEDKQRYTGLKSYCRKCEGANRRRWRKENPEKKNEQQRRYRARLKERSLAA